MNLCRRGNEQDLVVSWCIEKLIVENILPFSCNVKGFFYSDVRKTLNVLNYVGKSYEIYRFLCTKRNVIKLNIYSLMINLKKCELLNH